MPEEYTFPFWCERIKKSAKTGRTRVRPCVYSFLGHFISNTLFGRRDTLKRRNEIEVSQKEPFTHRHGIG